MKIDKFIISLQKVFEEKTILIFWNGLLFSGGVVFLSYFMHIQFVPELELKSAVLLFASGAIIAGIIVSFLCLLLILPGIFWYSATESSEFLLNIRKNDKKEYTKRIISWFGLPSFFTLFCLHLYFFGNKLLFGIFTGLSILFYIIAIFRCRPPKLWRSLLVPWLLGAAFFLFPLITIYKMASNAALENNIEDWTKIFLSIVFIVVSNISLLLKPSKQKRIIWVTIVALFSLAYVTMIIGAWSFIPQLIFSNTKLGNIVNAKIIMSKEGCEIFQLYNIDIDNTNIQEMCSNKYPVTILSRIGSNYYIESSRNKSEIIRFTLPPDTVKSWSIIESKSKK